MVPLAEIMFVPEFPARVVKVAGPVGQEANGSLVTLAMGSPAIAGQLSPSDAALVKAGMRITITDAATGLTRRGHIKSVGRRTKTKGSISGGVYVPMKVRPGRPLSMSMIGQDVSLTITAAHSAGPLLAVPEAAVFARADGRLYVTKVTGARSDVQVPVRVDATGNGMVGITPIDGGTLAGPAANGSASRSPARSSTTRRCCSATSPPATWTRPPPATCLTCWPACSGKGRLSWSSPTTPRSPSARSGGSRSATDI
jgi:hypothetical protein